MSRRKLLLADDSITIQKVVNLTFADEGVEVVTVGDGDAALAELAASVPDILLADVNMPGPTGYEICERLRADEATRNLPVILLVGSFEPFDETEASRVGANAYLTKPFQSIRQLVSQVNELIEAAKPAVETPVEELETFAETAAEPSPEVEAPHFSAATPAPEPAAESVAADLAVETEPDQTTDASPRYFDDLGYQTSLPPVQPAAAEAPVADEIESLYAESISAGEDGLSDVGIDDEMIETSYSVDAANNDLAEFQSQIEADSGSYEPEANSDNAEAAPEPSDAVSSNSFASGYEQRFPDDPSKFENTIAYENWQPADMRSEDERQVETVTPQSFETTRLDESFPQEAEQAPAAPVVGEDTIRMENRFDTTGSAFQFDDVDLLDLSADPNVPVEITSPADAIEKESSKQVVTLSPELIEMIAQRVVEKLSEKY